MGDRPKVSSETMANLRAILAHPTAREALRTPFTKALAFEDGRGHIHFSSTDDAVVTEFLAWCDERGVDPSQEPEVVPLMSFDAYVDADQAIEFKMRWHTRGF